MEETQHEVIEISLEKKIETELVKNNVTEAVISALKEKYGGLQLKSLDDKESYLEIKEAKKACSKIRNIAVKCCKEGRDEAIAIQKKWVAKEKEVVGQILEVESPLDTQIDKFDAEVERLATEEKRLQEEAYMHRTQELTKMGATYSEGAFSLGEFSIEANLVKESSQSAWEESMLPKFQVEYQKIEAIRIEEQKKKDTEEAELKRKQEEFAEQQRKFQEEQAEFQRKQDEAARAEREKQEAEQREIQKERNELHQKRFALIIPFNPTKIQLADLWQLSQDDFDNALQEARVDYEAKEAEKKRQIEEQAALAERERIVEENRLAEVKRQQEEQRKAEDLAKAGDKAKFDNFIEQVAKLSVPDVKSGQYRKICAIAKEKIEEILSLKA